MNMDHIAETFVRNVIYRYPASHNFTFSTIVHDMCGDDTGFDVIISDVCRKFAQKKIILDHGSGKKKIMYVKDKGNHGRNNRPTNLYSLKDATQ